MAASQNPNDSKSEDREQQNDEVSDEQLESVNGGATIVPTVPAGPVPTTTKTGLM